LGLAFLMAGDPRGSGSWRKRAAAIAEHDVHNAVTVYDTMFFGHLLSGDPARARHWPPR
jgi:hypothetical protein